MLSYYDTSSNTSEFSHIFPSPDFSGDGEELDPWEEDLLDRQREAFKDLQTEIHNEENRENAEEARSFSPLQGLDDSNLSDEVRWVYSNSWRGNTGSEDWTFDPSLNDLNRGEACLRGVSKALRLEATQCVEDGRASAAYYSNLHRLTFLHETIHAWYLNLAGLCGIEQEATKMWHYVLDIYWRKTPEHHAFEKMLRDRPEAKAKKKAYDARVKKTDEARAKNREAAKASRARKKAQKAQKAQVAA